MTPRHASACLSAALLGLAGTLLAWPGHAHAIETTTTALQDAATQAVRRYFNQPGNRVVASALPLDTRLQLTPCALPLRAAVPDGVRPLPQVSVPVSCPQDHGWTVRVLVRLQLYRQVLVTNRPLQRGDGLRAGDVHAEQRDIARLGYGYVDNLQQVAGRTLSRALPRGSVLNPAALGGRDLVRAGDRVQLVAQLGGIVVRANAVALGSGDNGARLRVRNDSSGKVVDAMVSGPGIVQALP